MFLCLKICLDEILKVFFQKMDINDKKNKKKNTSEVNWSWRGEVITFRVISERAPHLNHEHQLSAVSSSLSMLAQVSVFSVCSCIFV